MLFWWNCLLNMALAHCSADVWPPLIGRAWLLPASTEHGHLRGCALSLYFAVLFGVISAPVAGAQSGPSGWSLCNETSFVLEASVGSGPQGEVKVRGWLKLRPGECRQVLPAPLSEYPHFAFARTSSAHSGGERIWGGGVTLCVPPGGTFDQTAEESCADTDARPYGFRAVLVENRTRWKTTFKEPEPYGLSRARSAGLQRLLTDAGVERTRIDGFLGRRSQLALSRFKTSAELSLGADDNTVIDALEKRARSVRATMGLRVCNATRFPMWAAIGLRRGDGHESRGWWRLAPSQCAQPIDDVLVNVPHFIHAELETESGPRYLTSADETFCVGNGRFVISGRQNCEQRAYEPAGFRKTANPTKGRLSIELGEDDFEVAMPPSVEAPTEPATEQE
jgi:uncharacterized membrane protein